MGGGPFHSIGSGPATLGKTPEIVASALTRLEGSPCRGMAGYIPVCGQKTLLRRGCPSGAPFVGVTLHPGPWSLTRPGPSPSTLQVGKPSSRLAGARQPHGDWPVSTGRTLCLFLRVTGKEPPGPGSLNSRDAHSPSERAKEVQSHGGDRRAPSKGSGDPACLPQPGGPGAPGLEASQLQPRPLSSRGLLPRPLSPRVSARAHLLDLGPMWGIQADLGSSPQSFGSPGTDMGSFPGSPRSPTARQETSLGTVLSPPSRAWPSRALDPGSLPPGPPRRQRASVGRKGWEAQARPNSTYQASHIPYFKTEACPPVKMPP